MATLTRDLTEGAEGLVAEIEAFLARQAAPRTAHRLVTKTTQALVEEALGSLPSRPADPAPALRGPSRLLRCLPDRLVRSGRRQARAVSVREHLELTLLVIERYGWASGKLRTRSGRRCIAGAQTLLCRLGYGDENTVALAGRALDNVLRNWGVTDPYYLWNDRPKRRVEDVYHLIRTTIRTAPTNR